MGRVNSRAKGAAGEREFAEYIRRFGHEARRGQQFSGSKDSPDVVTSIKGVHFEVKRVQSLNISDAIEQAINDCGYNIPIVAHRKNGEQWLITLLAGDFFQHFVSSFLGVKNGEEGV